MTFLHKWIHTIDLKDPFIKDEALKSMYQNLHYALIHLIVSYSSEIDLISTISFNRFVLSKEINVINHCQSCYQRNISADKLFQHEDKWFINSITNI